MTEKSPHRHRPVEVVHLKNWKPSRMFQEALFILDGLIGLLSLGFLISNISTKFMIWNLRRELDKRELMHRDVEPIR